MLTSNVPQRSLTTRGPNICQGFPRVPWRYLDMPALHKFLVQRIAEGFSFPLNLKWVLCDPGWWAVYAALVASPSPSVRTCVAAWCPDDSGLREHLEAIHCRHPNGYPRAAGVAQPVETELEVKRAARSERWSQQFRRSEEEEDDDDDDDDEEDEEDHQGVPENMGQVNSVPGHRSNSSPEPVGRNFTADKDVAERMARLSKARSVTTGFRLRSTVAN